MDASLAATPNRITLGSFRIHAHFPGGRRMVIQVRQNRELLRGRPNCPFGRAVNTEIYPFPASYTSASVTSATRS